MSVHRLMTRPQRAQIAGGDFTSHLPQPSHFPLCRLIYSELAFLIRLSSAWTEFFIFIPPSILLSQILFPVLLVQICSLTEWNGLFG